MTTSDARKRLAEQAATQADTSVEAVLERVLVQELIQEYGYDATHWRELRSTRRIAAALADALNGAGVTGGGAS